MGKSGIPDLVIGKAWANVDVARGGWSEYQHVVPAPTIGLGWLQTQDFCQDQPGEQADQAGTNSSSRNGETNQSANG